MRWDAGPKALGMGRSNGMIREMFGIMSKSQLINQEMGIFDAWNGHIMALKVEFSNADVRKPKRRKCHVKDS